MVASDRSMRCLNCGNKAKRDCLYYRCRSCCRGHGFICQTHVKSTWVPTTRQLAERNPAAAMASTSSAAYETQHGHHQQQNQQQSHLTTSSGFGGHFPTEVSGEATFTRVQVAITSEENTYIDEQYAYETTISIRGHVFRGVLYDQGPDQQQQQPMMNTFGAIVNVGDEDQRGPTINMQSNLQSVNNPRPNSSSSTP